MVEPHELKMTQHGRDRMAERGISEEDIAWALTRETYRSPGEPGSIWIHGHPAGGRILKVCVRLDDERYVITAAWRD